MNADTTSGGEQVAASASPLRYGILLLAVGSNGPEIDPPEWLTDYDPDGGDENAGYPTGMIESHEDVKHAMTFATFQDAAECWKRQSKRTPFRPDGKPNRPLAAFTVSIERLP